MLLFLNNSFLGLIAFLDFNTVYHQDCHLKEHRVLYILYRGSYMSAHVLLNLLNELRKRDKM